jgi:hypothetical protein
MITSSSFFMINGRLPRVGDDPPPWKYQGWLLPYVQMCEMQLRGPESRWAYYFDIMETGEIPARPIPRLSFGEPDRKVYDAFGQWAKIVGYDMGGWSDFRSLLDWLLWSLDLTDEEPHLYGKDAAETLYRSVDIGPLLLSPYDYIGAYISEHKSSKWNPTAFFPTPHNVVECMVGMQMHDAGDGRTKTVLDPCVGTGRMLLHASNYSLRLYGQDIDPVALAGCKINGALYAPWMSYPLPEALFAEEDWFSAVCSEPLFKRRERLLPSLFDETR